MQGTEMPTQMSQKAVRITSRQTVEQRQEPGRTNKSRKTSPSTKDACKLNIIPAMICGLIISFIYMFGMKAKLDTAYKQRDAEVYRNADASVQVQKDEVFLTSSIIKKPLKKK